MTKILIAGLATVIIAGTALVGTGMYAASTNSSGDVSQGMFGSHMRQGNPENLVTSLSGKVSAEALTALQSLMKKHTSEMDTARSNTGTTVDMTARKAQRDTFKTEMDALLTQYPDLKAAMPTMQKGGKMGRGHGEMETIIATLPATVQTELKTIRESYTMKNEALRAEEKTKIDAILVNYPDIKGKLDAANANRPQEKKGQGRHRVGGHQNNSAAKINTSN